MWIVSVGDAGEFTKTSCGEVGNWLWWCGWVCLFKIGPLGIKISHCEWGCGLENGKWLGWGDVVGMEMDAEDENVVGLGRVVIRGNETGVGKCTWIDIGIDNTV